MDSALRTISYIADIGSIVVLMARQRMSQASSEDFTESPDSPGEGPSQYRMICYVFESEDVSFYQAAGAIKKFYQVYVAIFYFIHSFVYIF